MLEMVDLSVHGGEDVESHEAEFKEISETIELLKSRIHAIEEAANADLSRADRQNQIQEIITDREKRNLNMMTLLSDRW